MIIPLLVNAVCVEANPNKSPFVPSEKYDKAVGQSRRGDDAFVVRDDTKALRDEDMELAEEDRPKRYSNRYHGAREARSRRTSVHGADDRFVRSGGGGLAHKMAKDALKSPKVQETINKLSHVSSSKGGPRGKIGKVKAVGVKGRRSGTARKGRRKKKRKRHHRRSRKQHPAVQKGGPSKRTPDSKREISVYPTRTDRGANVMVKRDQDSLDDVSLDQSSAGGSGQRVTVVKVDDTDDYLDFSTARYTEPAVHRGQKLDGPAKLHADENMIDRLMRTTTRDPSKKKAGDQGVEYSDYYSDDEVLEDIAANKIPVQLVGTSGTTPGDRIVRQALDNATYRYGSPIGGSSRSYRGYDPRGETLGHGDDAVNSVRDFQTYPRVERLSSLRRRSRLTAADDPSLSYPTSGGPSEYQNENPDTSYGVNADGLEEQPQLDGGNDQLNNFDPTDIDKLGSEVEQTPVDVQSPDQFNYPNQYGNPQEETVNINEGVQPKLPPYQTLNNYQLAGTNFGQAESYDSNVMSQPRLDMKPQDVEVRTQPSYTPIQLYNNREGQLGEQAPNNYAVQPKYNIPAVNLQNAMDQPLGKILETLGINVNGGSTNPSQSSVLNENVNHPVSPYHGVIDHPLEHVISPSYVKKKPSEELSSVYENDSAKSADGQGVQLRNEDNAKEGFSRRQSIQNGAYNGNLLTHIDNDKSSMPNANISTAVQDTKEVASQILDTIMDELEELKTDRSKNNHREGSWSTAQAGMKLDMRVANRTIIVTLSDLATPRYHESLLNGTWNVSGHAPFKRGSPFTLIATDNNTNSMAVFVGACRVCQGVDTIAGVWSVARQPKDCRDFQVSTSVFNDIFRKTKLSSLKEKQGTTTTMETTLKHEKRKG